MYESGRYCRYNFRFTYCKPTSDAVLDGYLEMIYCDISRYFDTVMGCIDIILWLSVLRYIDMPIYCCSSRKV